MRVLRKIPGPGLLALFVLLSFLLACNPQKPESEIDKKVEALLSKMTLEEKIGQMTQICFSTITMGGSKELELDAELFRKAIVEHHVGSFLSGTGSSQQWVEFVTQVQKIAVEESRLGIPLIIGIDHVHGANYVDDATVLPHNLTLACSFDPELTSAGAKLTATETASLGLAWNFAPVLDVGKNPYWPRLYETFGEDPLVCAVLGTSFITAYQDSSLFAPYRLSACAKHFIGYSDPKSGWDRTPAEIPEQILYEQFIPPFQMAIDSGVKTVMVNSGEVNGEPVHTSKRLLTGVLREKLGFDGVLLTDIKDIMKVVEMHSGAETEKQATLMAINAGIDMSMACNAYDFCNIMKELVEEGKITEKRIDQSVRRILKLKFELGLFENPYPKGELIEKTGSAAHHQIAVKAAEESIVLLKNEDNFLPVGKNIQKIMVSGFAADSRKMLNGAWTLEWLGAEEHRHPQRMPTLFQSLKAEFPDREVSLVAPPDSNMAAFRSAARRSDLIVLTVGEKPYSEFKGNCNNLALAGSHRQMVEIAAESGTPVVLILVEGRPRVITAIEPKVQAVLFAGHPGEGGGTALARILSGKVNPSGKLAFSYPSTVGHFVPYYHKVSDKYEPLYAFGHGLSYTNFEYKNLQLSDTVFTSPDSVINISVEITNTGLQGGKETALWYVRDVVGLVQTRPAKQLKHFEKVRIDAGETKTLKFNLLPARHLSYPDRTGKMVLEKGQFLISIGGLEQALWFE